MPILRRFLHWQSPALAAAAQEQGGGVSGPVSQAEFLNRLGIATRADRLLRAAPGGQGHDIAAALHRLTGRDQMGELFKVMAIGPAPGGPPPPGFEETE